jgi:hypothetical protein
MLIYLVKGLSAPLLAKNYANVILLSNKTVILYSLKNPGNKSVIFICLLNHKN